MHNNPIDQFFKKSLQDYTSIVPEQIWERVIAEKEKDRKFFLFWNWKLLGSIFLIACLISGYWAMRSDKKLNNKQETVAKSKLESPFNIQKESKIESNNISSNKIFKKVGAQISNVNFKKTDNDLLSGANEQSFFVLYKYSKLKKSNLPSDFKNNQSKNYCLASKQEIENKTVFSSQHITGNKTNLVQPDSANNPDSSTMLNLIATKTNQQKPKENNNPPLQIANPSIVKQNSKNEKQAYLKERDWFIEAYGSPDIALLDLTPDNFSFSYTLGLRFEKQFSNHFIAKLGIEYTHLNLKSGYDSIAHLQIHYSSLDIPLILGYRIKGVKFNATIDAGILFNINSWYTWQIGNQNLNASYETKTGLSLYFGFNYERPINNRLIIFTEPFFKYYFSINSPMFLQRINVTGLTFGVKYDFIKSKNK